MNQPRTNATETTPSPPAEQVYPATSGMQLGYGIGEAELSSAEEEYRALVRTLRRSQGFGLLFVECSPATGTTLVRKLQADLPQKSTGVLSFAAPVPGGNLYHQVQTYLQTQPVEVLFIQGLEHSIFEYEDAQRLSGWTEAQIYTISWEGLPPLMRNLNWYREDFRDNLPPVCLVFLVRSFFINYLLHRAPDFFDWRSGLFRLPLDPEALEQQSQLALGDMNEYLAWSSPQRIQKILEIKDLLAESHQVPERQAELLAELGKLFIADQRYEEAIASYDRAVVSNPDKYKAWVIRGVVLGILGRHEEAISSSDRALAIKLDYDAAWINRGNALVILGRYEEALESYDRALAINPDDDAAWYNRGNALGKLGRYEEAIASYDQAVVINPDKYDVWFIRGFVLGILGRYEEAIESYDRALAIKPDKDEVWNSRGIALGKLGCYEEAVASYDQAVVIKPDNHEAWYNRGNELGQMGHYEEAIASYDQAVVINPDKYKAWVIRGVVLGILGRYEEAIESYDRAIASFDQAITVNSQYAYAIYSKAYCLSLMGDVDAAITHLQKAFELDPQCREMAQTGSDFDAIRDDDRFQALIQEQPVS